MAHTCATAEPRQAVEHADKEIKKITRALDTYSKLYPNEGNNMTQRAQRHKGLRTSADESLRLKQQKSGRSTRMCMHHSTA